MDGETASNSCDLMNEEQHIADDSITPTYYLLRLVCPGIIIVAVVLPVYFNIISFFLNFFH